MSSQIETATPGLGAVEILNGDQRLACILVLDTSGSMTGERIQGLNSGLIELQKALADNEIAKARVEVALLTFNNQIELIRDFALPDNFEPPTLVAGGQTHLGTALLRALDELGKRKEVYKKNGLPYNRPWLFLITDGQPEGEDPSKIEEAGRALREAEAKKQAIVWAVGVGDGVNYDLLRTTFGKEPARLKGAKWSEMFQWLSNSTMVASQSNSGDKVKLATPAGWAEFEE